jgi:hypothetical protein
MPDIIDFESERDRRIDADIDAGWAELDRLQDQLATIMAAWPGPAIILAGLRAMLETLESSGVSRHDAKAEIASCLEFED